MSQGISPTLTILSDDKKDTFLNMIEMFGFQGKQDYFDLCFERASCGDLDIIMAQVDGVGVGYTLFNRLPKYALFKTLNIPEIQDLNVLSKYRRNGIGALIIQYCENLAKKEGYKEIGIGVGLNSSFGSAQRLYARLGYIPDGAGVSYDRTQVACGEFRPIDDQLCLMMLKNLI